MALSRLLIDKIVEDLSRTAWQTSKYRFDKCLASQRARVSITMDGLALTVWVRRDTGVVGNTNALLLVDGTCKAIKEQIRSEHV